MRIIIGLGNPGKQYENTRHNAGFMLVDGIKEKFSFPDFEFSKKFNAEISKISYSLLLDKEKVVRSSEPDEVSKQEIILAKPQTFMNLSGQSVRGLLDFYKLSPEDILVIHDDKDIALGEYKIATDSSSAGHNGVQNIIENLGTQKFKRIRLGVGVETTLPAEVFVLQKFSDEEREKLEKVFQEVSEEIQNIL